MRDRGKIFAGLLLFFGLLSSPLWFNLASGRLDYYPEIVVKTRRVAGRDRCVMPVEYMRASHMTVLKEWRDTVVRNGERVYTTADGRQFERSLTGTCLNCHSNKSSFCDRCHDYAGVKPNCWDCHVAPKEDAQ